MIPTYAVYASIHNSMYILIKIHKLCDWSENNFFVNGIFYSKL